MARTDRTESTQSSTDAVLEEVRIILQEHCEVPAERAGAVTGKDAMADLGLDSIALAYVFTHFERKHDLTFENDDIDPLRYTTVGELVDAIARYIGEAAGH